MHRNSNYDKCLGLFPLSKIPCKLALFLKAMFTDVHNMCEVLNKCFFYGRYIVITHFYIYIYTFMFRCLLIIIFGYFFQIVCINFCYNFRSKSLIGLNLLSGGEIGFKWPTSYWELFVITKFWRLLKLSGIVEILCPECHNFDYIWQFEFWYLFLINIYNNRRS